jgi:hypothetical protein
MPHGLAIDIFLKSTRKTSPTSQRGWHMRSVGFANASFRTIVRLRSAALRRNSRSKLTNSSRAVTSNLSWRSGKMRW